MSTLKSEFWPVVREEKTSLSTPPSLTTAAYTGALSEPLMAAATSAGVALAAMSMATVVLPLVKPILPALEPAV